MILIFYSSLFDREINPVYADILFRKKKMVKKKLNNIYIFKKSTTIVSCELEQLSHKSKSYTYNKYSYCFKMNVLY